MKKLNRADLVELVGRTVAEGLDALDCEPTNRAGYQGKSGGNDLMEWSASLRTEKGIATAYYYTSQADEAEAEAHDGDWGSVVFEVSHYTFE